MGVATEEHGSLTAVREVLAELCGGVEPPDDATLGELGVDSATALRLRVRLERRLGGTVPLPTLRPDLTVSAAVASLDRRAESSIGNDLGAPDSAAPDGVGDEATLTPLQAAYWSGREPGRPLGGVASWWYVAYRRGREHGLARDPMEDVDRLERAWAWVLARHPALRLGLMDDGTQRIAVGTGGIGLRGHDLRHLGGTAADAAVRRILDEVADPARARDRDGLHDVRVLVRPDELLVATGFDAIALDLTSWRVVLRDWGTAFASSLDPATATPTPGFLSGLRARATDPTRHERVERDARWWRSRLDGLPDGPTLPGDVDLSEITGHRAVRRERRLDAAHWGALRREAARRGASPSGVVLAAFATALRRFGAAPPFAINATTTDRPAGHEAVVDDHATAVLVGLETISGGGDARTFADAAVHATTQLWDALEHRSFAGPEVLRELARQRGRGPLDPPSHPVVFTSGLDDPHHDVPHAWLGQEIEGCAHTPQVALDHLVLEEDGALRLLHDAAREVLDGPPTEGLIDLELRLLERLADDPDSWDRRDLAWDPAVPGTSSPRPLAADCAIDAPWRQQVDRRGTEVAVIAEAQHTDHGTLARRVDALAARLQRAGVAAGEPVLVACEKGTAQLVAILGIIGAGAAYVPVDPSWPPARLAAVVRRSGASHAITAGAATSVPGCPAPLRLGEDGSFPDEPGATVAPPAPAPDDLAYAIFTSGSTGEPKGVAIAHQAARTTIDEVVDRFGIGPTDRVLGVSAATFDLSVFDVFGVLGVGGTVVLPTGDDLRDPLRWAELIGRHGVTVWNSAPALLEMLVEHAEDDPHAAVALHPLRLVLLSGDWIPLSLPRRLRALVPGAQVISLGGATEASIWSITHPIGDIDPGWRSIPYGRPLTGQGFHILDEDWAPVPIEHDGELHITGAGLALGYLGDPDQTAARFMSHPVTEQRLYRTGDLGRWWPDGTIEFLGRTDRQVKVHGHRIELGDVEAALDRCADLRTAVASAPAGPDGRPRLVAHLVPRGGRELDRDAIRAQLRDLLPEYLVPSHLVVLDDLPVTANGKVDHAALPSPFRRGASAPDGDTQRSSEPTAPTAEPAPAPPHPREPAPDPGEPPRDIAVVAALEVVAEVLGRPADPGRSLVAAGATSLELVRVASRLHGRLGRRPSFADLARPGPLEVTLSGLFYGVEPVLTAGAPSPSPARPPSTEPASSAAPVTSTGALPWPPVAATVELAWPKDGELPEGLRAIAGWVERLQQAAPGAVRTITGPTGLRVELPASRTDGAPAAPTETAPTETAPTEDAAPSITDHPPTIDGSFPLSEMQLAYLVGRADSWLGAPVAPHYHTEVEVEDLDVQALQAAWDLVVSRHPMLRAEITDDVRQTVRPDARIVVEHENLADRSPEDRERRLDAIREELSHRRSDPQAAPLWRVVALYLGDRCWHLHLSVDLLFCDAGSAVRVADEVERALRGEVLPAAPTSSFAEVMDEQEQRRARTGQRRAAIVERRAAALPPAPPLPLRPVADRVRFVRRRTAFEVAATRSLRTQAADHDVTLAGALLGVVGEVVTAAVGDAACVVVTTADPGERAGAVVGDHTATLVIGAGGLHGTVASRLQAAQRQLWQGLEDVAEVGLHGNEVIRELGRRAGHPVVLPVVLSSGLGVARDLDGRDVDASRLFGRLGRTVSAISQTPHVALDCQLFVQDGALQLVWDAVEDAFPPGWLDRAWAAFTAAVTDLAHAETWERTSLIGPDAVPAATAAALLQPGRESPAPLGAGAAGGEAPQREVARIRGILGELLGQDPSDLATDVPFLELGADSLTLVRTHARLRRDGATGLSILDLFTHASISRLAVRLDQLAGSDSGDDVVAAAARRGAARRVRRADRKVSR